MADENRYRPLRPGAQIAIAGNLGAEQGMGTIACFVNPFVSWDGNVKVLTRHPCILTCHHVVKPPNIKPVDNLIHQPAPVGFDRVIGSFYVGEWDVALCALSDRAMDQGGPVNDILGGIGPIIGIADVRLGDTIRKYGRTTGATQGNYSTNSQSCKGVMSAKCFLVVPPQVGGTFCDEGDSGSALVNAQGELVGILQAKSSPQANLLCGIGIPATYVFQRLTALVQEKESPNYPDKDYPNKQFGLSLVSAG